MSIYSKYSLINPFDFEGLNIRELTPPDLDFSSVAEIEIPPGHGHRQARSSKCAKIYICTRGVVSFCTDKLRIDLLPMDTILISINKWFSYNNNESEMAKLLLIHSPAFDMNAEEFR